MDLNKSKMESCLPLPAGASPLCGGSAWPFCGKQKVTELGAGDRWPISTGTFQLSDRRRLPNKAPVSSKELPLHRQSLGIVTPIPT